MQTAFEKRSDRRPERLKGGKRVQGTNVRLSPPNIIPRIREHTSAKLGKALRGQSQRTMLMRNISGTLEYAGQPTFEALMPLVVEACRKGGAQLL